MKAASRAIVPRAPAAERPRDGVSAAEARLRGVLAEVTDLDLAVEELSAGLDAFAAAYERRLAEPFAEADQAERLVRRMQALEDELARLAERARATEAARAPRRRPRRGAPPSAARPGWHDGEGDAGEPAPAPAAPVASNADAPPEIEPEEAARKRVYRRLARVLHPDLARDDAERARLGELMARVNAAYAKGDRTALELMAEKVGAGEPLGDLSDEERLAHLDRRVATLSRIAASLRREKARLEGTRTFRLRDEAARRETAGRDYFEETRAELAEEAGAAYADALSRLARISRAARELGRARKVAMSTIVRRGPTGARRAFDPLGESALVRRGAARLERERATAPARELARKLEEDAVGSQWEAALTLLAFFAEAGGARPPDSLATPEGWAARWDLVRADWPEAPDLARALARLPRHLEVGVRAHGEAFVGGVQLAAAELAAGVSIALERQAFGALGRRVLAALGPEERCGPCEERVVAIHLLRTRGLDELNGLCCPRCGAVLRSYWRYGEAEGLEALAPHALRLGLVAEQAVSFAGTTIGFQMLPAELERLTADR
ncbi:MAG TPA: molecular chaperone DnaJ, partial [Anaeromyxobacter sp.]